MTQSVRLRLNVQFCLVSGGQHLSHLSQPGLSERVTLMGLFFHKTCSKYAIPSLVGKELGRETLRDSLPSTALA